MTSQQLRKRPPVEAEKVAELDRQRDEKEQLTAEAARHDAAGKAAAEEAGSVLKYSQRLIVNV